MKRKLVKQGRNALTITLPAEWTKKFGLKAGDEVDVQDIKNNISVSVEKNQEMGKKIIDVSGLGPMTKRILGAIYKAGYDEVEVRFETPEELEMVQNIVRQEFIGFETVHHSRNSLVFKQVASIDPNEFNTMVRRMFLIIKSMGEDCAAAIRKKDNNLLKMVSLRDKDVNNIADYCRRLINSYSHQIEGRAYPLYFIIEQVEKIGDLYKGLCNFLIENRYDANGDLAEILEQTNLFFDDFYNAYFNFDVRKMPIFLNNKNKLIKRLDALSDKSSKEEYALLFYIRSMVDQIYDMNGSLMSTKL